MHRILLTAALGLGLAAGAQAATSATVVIQAGPQPVIVAPMMVQPPPPRYETMPRARRGMVWSQGYWELRGHRHVWVPGAWVSVRPGYVYHQPAWQQRGNQWYFQGGGWDRRGPDPYRR